MKRQLKLSFLLVHKERLLQSCLTPTSFPSHVVHLQRWSICEFSHSFLSTLPFYSIQRGLEGSCNQNCTQILLFQVKNYWLCPQDGPTNLENFVLCQISPRFGKTFIHYWSPHHSSPMFTACDIPSNFCSS